MKFYCIYSNVINMYWNFIKECFTSINNDCFATHEDVNKKIKTIEKCYTPEIHILSTKPIEQYEEISLY